jgi:hypothetical protein
LQSDGQSTVTDLPATTAAKAPSEKRLPQSAAKRGVEDEQLLPSPPGTPQLSTTPDCQPMVTFEAALLLSSSTM